MNRDKVVYEHGNLVVVEVHKYACKACVHGWNDGSLLMPKDGGEICEHGKGTWTVGMFGPRGGWKSYSPWYHSKAAAVLICDALIEAARMPEQGVS